MIENKLGITNSAALTEAEERISKKKAVELFEDGYLDKLPSGAFCTLSEIHRVLFEDIYEFAGKIRSVNISKGSFRFVPVIYLADSIKSIERMPQSNFDEIIEKYVEMNVAHPFREGNGRSMRIWLDNMLKTEIQRVIGWDRVNKEDYLLAMERSSVRNTEIKVLLGNALTDKINDRYVYIKGIDNSYNYEGYNAYEAEKL